MSSFGSPSPFFLAGKKAYEIERSLRFNSSDSAYLQRTPSSAGNRQICTFSCWVKRSNLDTTNCLASAYSANNNSDNISMNLRELGSGNCEFRVTGYFHDFRKTTRLFRDVSAWYHIVVAFDTTQSSADDRIKIYINGVQETSFSVSGNVTQNMNIAFNDTSVHRIGTQSNSLSNYVDGYMAEINFLDGYAYDASYFGETDALTGQWNPKKYVGSYGTNGYYLNFSDNSGTTATTLGKDSSGNGNNFTPNNFSVAAGAGNDSLEDSPTNNFCTFNPLFAYSTNFATFSNGNLDHSLAVSQIAASSFLIPKTGKWYAEFVLTAGALLSYLGVRNPALIESNYSNGISMMQFTDDGSSLSAAAQVRVDNSYVETLSSSYADNDILGIKVDRDAGTIQFTKNGSNISTAINLSGASDTSDLVFVLARSQSGSYSFAGSVNFGQRSFSYLPTGYKSLCSANLSDPTILLPNKHFGTLLWTGNATVRTISDTSAVNFTPDWVWVKSRSSGDDHQLTDSVRGSSKALKSNATDAEIDWDTAYSGNNKGMGDYVNGGFILDDNGNNNRYNRNSATFVAWNWNAGDTDGKTYAVKVVSDSGNKYRFDNFGTSAVTLDLAEGGTYIFDQSDSSNAGHPLRFSTTSNGTHGGGSEYTTGVTTNGTAGQAGAYTQIVVAASAPTLYYYCTQHSGMGGQANTNSTLGSSNFDGTIQSVAKVNASAGFSIVTYTGNGTGGATIGHGLGVTPNLFFVKNRGTGARIWLVYHSANTSEPATEYLQLDGTAATADDNSAWNDTAPTSTVFSIGTSASSNNNGEGHVAYCFSEVAGYSKFGSYTGNGSTDGTFVFTGFRPAWIMTKRTDGGSQNWLIHDIKRDPHNVANKKLAPNLSSEENNSSNIGSSSQDTIDILSNGFKMRSNNNHTNISGGTFIYLAFAESPFKNARAR